MPSTSCKSSPTRFVLALALLIIFYKLLQGHSSTEDISDYAGYTWSSSYNFFGSSASAQIPLTDSATDHLELLAPGTSLDTLCTNHRLQPYPDRYHHRKVYDLILINDELDWLLIRLGQMSPHVDHFIIVESDTTFSNTPKPLHVQENYDLFMAYHSKMLVHTLNETGHDFSGKDSWAREEFSRNAMFTQTFPLMENEATPQYGDVIISGDVDELVRPEVLSVLRNCQIPRHVRLHTRIYYYSFQWLSRGRGYGDWDHPDATYFSGFESTKLPQDLRGGGEDMEIWNAGWHCSFCFGSLRQMISKVKSFSHTEMNRPELLEVKGMVARVRSGIDLFMRAGSDCHRVDEILDVPEFLVRNREDYRYLFQRDGEDAGFSDYWEVLEEIEDGNG